MTESRSLKAWLVDMQGAIQGIQDSVQDLDYVTYQHNWTIKRAVERGLEIISEASRHLPESLKAQYPEIPWQKVAGIGNVLRHEYFRIADDILWTTIQADLLQLKDVVDAMLKKLENT